MRSTTVSTLRTSIMWTLREPKAIRSREPRCEAAHGSQQRWPSVGWTVTTDGKGRGFQFSHAELVEQLVVGAVGADLRQRVCRGLRQQLVAKGEGDICASNVP